MSTTRLTAVIALGALLAGCATTAPKPGVAEAATEKGEPELVQITGSRIPRSAEHAEGGSAATIYPLYVVDRDELWNTGATSVGRGLGHLPFIDIHR